MSHLVSDEQMEAFANYAEKHEIFEMFRDAISKLVIAKPSDPYQFLIDYFAKPRGKFIILFSPPGSGVSTAVDMLVKQYEFLHIKTATLLEREIEKQTSIGLQAQPYVDKGMLVPDQLITSMVFKELKENEAWEKGYILDGYPKTKQQAVELLQGGFIPDYVIDVDLPDTKIMEYAQSGRVDPRTNRLYNAPQEKSRRISVLNESASAGDLSRHVDIGLVKKKLDDYRNNYHSFIGMFKTNYRRFHLSLGFEGQEQKLLQDIQEFLGTGIPTKAPRGFRIIVGGLPGAGKSFVAQKIASKFGAIVVSPKSVMLQAISAGDGEEYLPFLNNPNMAPPELFRDALVSRLKQKDCRERGWVLDGFPYRAKDAEYLEQKGIHANRFIWIDTPLSTCWERLHYRRHDPNSSKVINVKSGSRDTQDWIHADEDKEEQLNVRFKEYETAERDLKKVYGLRTPTNPTGIMYSIPSYGVGDSENGESFEKVWEMVEASMLRPIPYTLQ